MLSKVFPYIFKGNYCGVESLSGILSKMIVFIKLEIKLLLNYTL